MIAIEQVPAYVVWPIRQEVMYPEHTIEQVKLADDEDGIHLALYDNRKLISIVSLFLSGDEMQFRKFATLKAYQNRGYGSELLKYVFTLYKQYHCKRLWCNARLSATMFYKNFGFTETAHRFYKDGHEFIIMEYLN